MTAAVATGFAPVRWLGGPSPFGIALPDASPTAATMYAPRGVCLTDDAVIAADTGNHRLLIWHDPDPSADHQPADVVVGQPDMTSEGPGLLFLPTGVLVVDGRLVVADAWHHRILIWDEVPVRGDEPPSMVLGQPDGDSVDEGCAADRCYWPFGIAVVDGVFWVADTGNRRLLGWSGGVPAAPRPADLVVGQPDFVSRGENRDGAVSASSLRWPHAIAAVDGHVFVADAGNHRVLGWRGGLEGDRPADLVLGQPGFTTAEESPYRPQGPRSFRFPYSVATTDAGELLVADTSNNRIGVVDDVAATFGAEPAGPAVDAVIGQHDHDANGENRWDRVQHDTFCWPYGLSVLGDRFAVADSGNNRVMIWERR